MDAELGMLFYIYHGRLTQIDVHPLTKYDGEDYVLSVLQCRHYERGVAPTTPAYWVPLSAFTPMTKTGATELTKDVFTEDCDCENDLEF